MCSTFADANKENVYEKGKAPLLTANEEDTGEGDDAEDDDDEDDANEGDAGDMQVRNSYRLLLCASHIPKQLLLSTIASSHCAPCLWAAEVDRSENNFRLQLAWEMLEVARSIYSKMGDEKALALCRYFHAHCICMAFNGIMASIASISKRKTLGTLPVMQV